MAVTKIHRTSRTALLIGVFVSLVVMGLFYLGGQVAEAEKIVPDMSQPKFTDIVLYWAYILLIVTVACWFIFGLFGFLKQFKESPKKALGGFLTIAAIAAMLIVFYLIGNGQLLNIPGYSGHDNNPGTLKMTDMWLFSCYVMLGLTVLSILLLPLFKKRR